MRGSLVTPMRRVWRRGEYEISTDPARVDVGLVHDFLARCPELQGLRRWDLATNDAHELYRRFGFREANPTRTMERLDPAPEVYRRRG